MTITVAKLGDRFVRVVRTQRTVAFSQQPDWVLLQHDIHVPDHKRFRMEWVPASTRFEWVRAFHF